MSRLLHGEGVSIGMVLAHGFSKARARAVADTGRVAAHLAAAGLPTKLSDIPGDLPDTAFLMNAIGQDKKVVRGALTFILTNGIGKAFIERNVDPATVAAYLDEMRGAWRGLFTTVITTRRLTENSVPTARWRRHPRPRRAGSRRSPLPRR